MPRIGRTNIHWSVNKLARAVTKWTRAGDKRLARLPTQMITDKIAMWKTRFRIVDVLYSKIPILPETLRTLYQLREESYLSSEVEHLFMVDQ